MPFSWQESRAADRERRRQSPCCADRNVQVFFSVPEIDAIGALTPGKVIPRRIRLKNGGTTYIPLPLVPYRESPTKELVQEISA